MKLIAGADQARVKMLADAEATRIRMTAEADADREARVGIAKAIAIEEQVAAYGGPQLQLAQDVMTKLASAIETSKVPIVPQTVVNMGGAEGGDASGVSNNAFGLLLALLTTEKLGSPIVPQAADARRSAEVEALRTSVMTGATKAHAGEGTMPPAQPAPQARPAARPATTPAQPAKPNVPPKTGGAGA
jgi:hypothetical protein